ncbi:MAG: acyl-CoA dehydrogenase, partial [Flavobacteriales bacterium]
AAVQKLMMQLDKEQEILMNVADMITQTYIAESTLLRTEKLVGIKGEAACKEQIEMMKVCFYDASEIIGSAGKEALCSFADGDELRMMAMGMKRFTKMEIFNVKDARRVIAAKLIEANTYCY